MLALEAQRLVVRDLGAEDLPPEGVCQSAHARGRAAMAVSSRRSDELGALARCRRRSPSSPGLRTVIVRILRGLEAEEKVHVSDAP